MFYQQLEDQFRRNLENRYMDGVYLPHMFKESIRVLASLDHIVIVTGFIVKAAMAGETDGPPGALVLARAFEGLGKRVTLVTDSINEGILSAGKDYLKVKASIKCVTDESLHLDAEDLFKKTQGLGIIAIERPSRARDNECYSMGGERLTPYVPNTDLLFNKAKELHIPTIGIGDGGNEVGMGVIREYVVSNVPKGELICANTTVDYLILGGTSNWAAYGICAALSIYCKKNLMHTIELERGLLTAITSVGAVDGMEKKSVLKVDGISFDENAQVVSAMAAIMETYL